MSKQMLELADELENIRKRGHFPNDSLIEDVVAALRSSAGSDEAGAACKNCRHKGSHLVWRCDACSFEVKRPLPTEPQAAPTREKMPEIPDDDTDFTPDLARKILAKYQSIIATRASAGQDCPIGSSDPTVCSAGCCIRCSDWRDGFNAARSQAEIAK